MITALPAFVVILLRIIQNDLPKWTLPVCECDSSHTSHVLLHPHSKKTQTWLCAFAACVLAK